MKEERIQTAVFAGAALLGEMLEVQKDVCIMIRDGKISDVQVECVPAQAHLDRLKQEGVRVINLENMTVLPGLFDCHTHLAMDAGKAGHLMMPQRPREEQMKNALEGLEKDLMAGITTARCMGDRDGLDFELKQRIAQGEVKGPELLACGTGMRSPNGHGFAGVPQESPEAYERTCAQNIAAGADHLKIFVTPGVPEPSQTEVPCYMAREEIRLVAEAARLAGISSTAHCIGGKGLTFCIEEGIDVLEHLYSVTPQEICMLEDRFDGWIDLTSGIVLDEGREPFVPEETAKRMKLARPYVAQCLAPLYRSKKLCWTLGTDAYHGMLYKELEIAEDMGASAADALKAVTVNAAEMTGLGGVKGQISTGFQADLIALQKNPLEDLKALRNVCFVMCHGAVCKWN